MLTLLKDVLYQVHAIRQLLIKDIYNNWRNELAIK